MNRLLALAGGQPLRSNDWEFIQNATVETIKALVIGIKGTPDACIVSGLEISFPAGTGLVTVSAGVLFDGSELCYCPAFTHAWIGGEETDGSGSSGYYLFFKPKTTSSEVRTFKNTQEHAIYQHKEYEIDYQDAIPAGSFGFPPRLLDLLTHHVLDAAPPVPDQVVRLAHKTFTAASLDQWQSLIAAPGNNKAIKVISMSARIIPTTPLGVANQTLNVFYGQSPEEIGIGSFPTFFLESATELHHDMAPVHAIIYNNLNVGIGLSNEEIPSGSASIVFYCYYTIIAL